MTPLELAKLLEYIRKNNGWGENMYENQIVRHRRCFKYIKTNFDTRDGHIWKIEFLSHGSNIVQVFNVETKYDIDEIYKYLDEEYND